MDSSCPSAGTGLGDDVIDVNDVLMDDKCGNSPNIDELDGRIEKKDGTDLDAGPPLEGKELMKRMKRDGINRSHIFLENIPEEYDLVTLNEIFSKYGKVVLLSICKQTKTAIIGYWHRHMASQAVKELKNSLPKEVQWFYFADECGRANVPKLSRAQKVWCRNDRMVEMKHKTAAKVTNTEEAKYNLLIVTGFPRSNIKAVAEFCKNKWLPLDTKINPSIPSISIVTEKKFDETNFKMSFEDSELNVIIRKSNKSKVMCTAESEKKKDVAFPDDDFISFYK